MARPGGEQVHKQSRRSVEPGHADLEEHQRLPQFRRFGLDRARAQAGLDILAGNGLILMRILLQRRDSPPPHPAPGKPSA